MAPRKSSSKKRARNSSNKLPHHELSASPPTALPHTSEFDMQAILPFLKCLRITLHNRFELMQIELLARLNAQHAAFTRRFREQYAKI